ncbi:hypothetical protein [Carboxylicivirga taeanensis]|uniref:hypothetical protein n=1 Tax=Carboxylicivirga taeanensis TaxID=1416875 RepID=UPI003F6E07D2
MDKLIDILFQTLGPILFIALVIIALVRFRKLSIRTNGITILGIIISLICAWNWMEKGLELKNSEGFFIERKEGKYSSLTDEAVQEKLDELNLEEKNSRNYMTLFGIGFLVITATTLTINLKEKIKPAANTPL